jgi:hypothetical protein
MCLKFFCGVIASPFTHHLATCAIPFLIKLNSSLMAILLKGIAIRQKKMLLTPHYTFWLALFVSIGSKSIIFSVAFAFIISTA